MDYLSVLRLTLVWCCIMCKCSILTIWNMHVDGTSGRHTLICWCSLKRDDTLKWICRTQEDYVKAVHLFPDFTAQVTSAVLSLQRQTLHPWQQRRPHGLREQDNLPKCSVWRRLKCCCISLRGRFQPLSEVLHIFICNGCFWRFPQRCTKKLQLWVLIELPCIHCENKNSSVFCQLDSLLDCLCNVLRINYMTSSCLVPVKLRTWLNAAGQAQMVANIPEISGAQAAKGRDNIYTFRDYAGIFFCHGFWEVDVSRSLF